MRYKGLFIGLTTIDIQYFINQFPKSNKKIKANPPELLVGGPATNAAVAFSSLNKGAFLSSSVGNNSFTNFIRNDFKNTNINFNDIIEQKNKNPVLATVITSINNGDRNIFTHNPKELKAEISSKELFKLINPEIILLDGFYPNFAIDCAQFANDKKIPVVVDCGSWKPHYDVILNYSDVVICSSDFFPPQCNNNQDVFSFLEQKGVKKIAISRGAENLLYINDNEKGEITIDKIEAIDTLGAGDFLHGAFCYYYLYFNKDFKKALKNASQLASFTCQYQGTRDWLNFIK